MIRKLLTGIIAATTLLFGGVVFAQTTNIDVMHLPKLDQYVNDFAGVLDQATLNEMNQHAYEYNQNSGHQFVAVLIPDRQGRELFDIALATFNANGIGSKDKNDGLLLVIATDEKKIRIMVGYGLEAEMPDTLASKIIENDIRPLVNAGDFAGAVRAFYTRSEEAIAGLEAMQDGGIEFNAPEIDPVIFLINLAGFLVVMIFDIVRGVRDRKRIDEAAILADKTHNKTKRRRKIFNFPIMALFTFHLIFMFSGANSYILGPFIAGWVGMIVYAAILSKGKLPTGGGRSSGGRSSGGGSSWGSSSSSSSSFSGGGGSSGGGGAGD